MPQKPKKPCRECDGDGVITIHLYVEMIVDAMVRGAWIPLGLNAGGDARVACPYCTEDYHFPLYM